MKIKYFSYIAERSFKTSPSGERLFYYLGGLGGFWLKPYIIPDQVTEKRLFKKHLWMLRIFIGTMILGQPFLFIAIPNIVETPMGFIFYFVAIMLLYWLVNWVIFRKDLSQLSRVNTRLSITAFYRDLANKYSAFGLTLGVLGSIGFVWTGSWIIKNEINPFVGWVTIIFFGFCAIAWGYTLFLKLTMPKNSSFGDNKTEA